MRIPKVVLRVLTVLTDCDVYFDAIEAVGIRTEEPVIYLKCPKGASACLDILSDVISIKYSYDCKIITDGNIPDMAKIIYSRSAMAARGDVDRCAYFTALRVNMIGVGNLMAYLQEDTQLFLRMLEWALNHSVCSNSLGNDCTPELTTAVIRRASSCESVDRVYCTDSSKGLEVITDGAMPDFHMETREARKRQNFAVVFDKETYTRFINDFVEVPEEKCMEMLGHIVAYSSCVEMSNFRDVCEHHVEDFMRSLKEK